MSINKKKGFTLLEMMVVVIIIGVLVYISVPMYEKVVQQSSVSDALHNMNMFSEAQSKYFMMNGAYADSLSKLETPLKSEDDEVFTNNFTYSAGNPKDDDFCIYANSNTWDYVLAKNYKKNSKVLCTGSDCEKINSFVDEGNYEEVCSGDYESDCDISCEPPKVLKGCSCACDVNCGKKLLNNNTCECYCNPKDKEACSGSNQVFDSEDCSCKCAEEMSCEEGSVFNTETCQCSDSPLSCNKTNETCKQQHGNNFILGAGCKCVCGVQDASSCKPDQKLDLERCICTPISSSCELTNDKCKEQNPNSVLGDDCECVCNTSADSCSKNQIFQDCKCSCKDSVIASCTGNYVLDGGCYCNCGLTAEKCAAEGKSFDVARCSCESTCNKTNNSCRAIQPHWVLLPGCECGCPHVATCTPPQSVWNALTCSCEQVGCTLTDSDCKDINENYQLSYDGRECTCTCGLDKIKCGQQHGYGWAFDPETCSCFEVLS